ncbi:MAG: DUF1127 domain-containing protein [Jannaschia sp.]
MATFDILHSTRPSAGPLFADLFGRIVAWNDRRVTVKMLNRLTDRELDDIGLRRAQIVNFAAIRR